MCRRGFATRPLLAAALLLAAAAPACAQSAVEQFYRGKKLDLIIGYSSGGTYDLYARLVARHLGQFIPGNPAIVPRNMPGAGSRTAANYVFNVAPKDGTVLATGDQSMPVAQAMGDRRLTVDTTKFIYVGNPAEHNNTVAVWHAAGVTTIEGAKQKEITMGATGSGTSVHYPRIMNELLGTKFKIIQGYPGGNDINLAMERGEVDGRGSNSWLSWKATRPDWLKEKKIHILVQVGLKKEPDLDAPLLLDLAANEDDKAALRLMSVSPAIGRPIFTTPDVPPERVQALRDAFDRMVRDPAFLEQAKKEHFDIAPVSGAEMQRIVAEVVATPKHIGERLARIVEAK